MQYTIEKIMLDVSSGEVLDDMYRKACFAALENRCYVEFIHNDSLFGVNYDDLIGACGVIAPCETVTTFE